MSLKKDCGIVGNLNNSFFAFSIGQVVKYTLSS